jgi:D-3-phosphoglycerate dehydrogenase
MVRIVATYLQSGEVPNVVNLHPPRPARWTIIVRHRDRVGVLAGVLGVLREEQLNVQEMQNVVFAGNEAASATITLEREPDTVLLGRLRQHSDILAIEVRAVL